MTKLVKVKKLMLGSDGFPVSILALGKFSDATSILLAFYLRPEPPTSSGCWECHKGKMGSSGK